MIPNTIYLQVEDQYGVMPEDGWTIGNEITWCVDRVNDSDLVYVAEAELKRATELMPCGHPRGCVVSAPYIGENKSNVCGWCADIERQKQATHDVCRAACDEEHDALREKLKAAEELIQPLEYFVRNSRNCQTSALCGDAEMFAARALARRRNKYNAKTVHIDGYRFDSKAEARRYGELKLMEKAGEITDLRVHPRFILQGAFIDKNGKKHRTIWYVADFSWREDVALIVHEVKGYKTATWRIKEKLFRWKYPDIELRVLEV